MINILGQSALFSYIVLHGDKYLGQSALFSHIVLHDRIVKLLHFGDKYPSQSAKSVENLY